MRKATILFKGLEAGELAQDDSGMFIFTYNDRWMFDVKCPAICLTLPKTSQTYQSAYLFPFFYNMLPEGANKQVVCKLMRIDENDSFGLLIAAAKYDTIGAVTVTKIQESE